MRDIIIFGNGKIADVIQFYMRKESNWPVKAFTVDRDYINEGSFKGLPVLPFEDIEKEYSPDDYDMFVAVGYHELNDFRTQKVQETKNKGYNLVSYVHPDSSIPEDLNYGENCFIMNNVCIHPRVSLGDNVFVWSGVMIGHHTEIASNCWITSSANISGNVTVGQNCFFAVNATLGHSIDVGDEAFIGANALVIKDLDGGSVVIADNDKPIKLSSRQFLRMSNFSNL